MKRKNTFWALSLSLLLLPLANLPGTRALETDGGSGNNAVATSENGKIVEQQNVAIPIEQAKPNKGSDEVVGEVGDDGENDNGEISTEQEKPTLVDQFFGADIKQIISSPDRVESFQLGPELADEATPTAQQFGKFPKGD